MCSDFFLAKQETARTNFCPPGGVGRSIVMYFKPIGEN
jgi:hypothetical protein